MLDAQLSINKLKELGFFPPKLRGGGNPDFGPIMEFLERRIAGVMDFYVHCRSEAVMCRELRARVNSELAPIVKAAEKTFNLEPMGLVLRVRASKDPGMLTVRAEKIDLC